ncbi:glutathione S-transferase theta-1-like [Culicoides brevitarsis]|uniref:glutathione S-transferase theta-1-like n=1 Tax=Culicoides brevitarsis TaxID=469753 RepID=UPI00307B82FA
MSKNIKLYFDLMSQPSRAMYILFDLAQIPTDHQPVALRKGAHMTDEFKAINRFQKVPCIVDHDGFKLSESIAILRYLDRKNEFPLLKNLYPEDTKHRAQVDEFLEWQHNGLRIFCAMYFQLAWLLPILTGKPSAQDRVDEMKDRMEMALDTMEDVWLGEKNKFITGEKLTAADIWAACEIEQPKMAGYDPVKGRPRLANWLKEVRNATNPVYDEAHKYVRKICESSKKAKL